MLAGRPIIASYSGYKSMINEANCGKFVEVDNKKNLKKAILEYSNLTKQERVSIGEKGRQWLYQNRTYEKLAENYLEIIDKL